MNARIAHFILTLTLLISSLTACVKNEAPLDPPVNTDPSPSIPSGSRIIIHFGTSTQMGCMYSFSNCIWIGWGATALNYEGRMALQFDQGNDAGQYFGRYFPLTADYVVDEASAKSIGIEPQVIPAGFYPLRDVSSGQATGKRIVVFDPAQAQLTGNLVNAGNPQDNIGQLHNLAAQVILNDNRDALKALQGDKAGTQKLVAEKSIAFMAEAELPVSASDQKNVLSLNLDRNFGDYAARVAESHLSSNDQKAILEVFDAAAATPVTSAAELQKFLTLMTEHENRLAQDKSLDDPKAVLSMVSVLKYSRYFWFWKSVSGQGGNPGTVDASKIPDWVWADIIGLELGGPAASVVASVAVYLDQR